MRSHVLIPVVSAILLMAACQVSRSGLTNDGAGMLLPPLRMQGNGQVFDTRSLFMSGKPDAVQYNNQVFRGDSVLLPAPDDFLAGNLSATKKNGKEQLDLPVLGSFSRETVLECPGATHIKGEFNAWVPQAIENGRLTLRLKPGTYAWQGLKNDSVILPPGAATVSNGMGGRNALLKVPGADYKPQLRARFENDSFSILLEALPASLSARILVYWNNRLIQTYDGSERLLQLPLPKEAGTALNSQLRVFAATSDALANDLLLPLYKGRPIEERNWKPTRANRHAMVMYFAMVDRFADGNPANNKPLKHPQVTAKTNFHGGDMDGIREKAKAGFFDDYGALWVSPLSRNPDSAWGLFSDPKVKFSAYHGYWPVSSTEPDLRFTSGPVLRKTLKTLHSRGLDIYLDYVAHHVHLEHPVYKAHPDWVTSLYLPDGSLNTERWDDHRLTTWFDVFLPTLDLSRPEVAVPMADSALIWLQKYRFDGFRHDATKHIPDLYTRTLTAKLRQEITANRKRPVFQIGETYGSPALIASYVGPGLLDAQFDFNQYDAMVQVFARNASFLRLQDALQSSLDMYGSHHLMGNITGNQDKPRFMSLADGSIPENMPWDSTKRLGHEQTIGLKNDSAYARFLQFYAWLMAIPGIPVVYYGDEIGMPGANDPDNRRPMDFGPYSGKQAQFHRQVKELVKLRRRNLPLAHGETRIIHASENRILLERDYLGQRTYVAINRDAAAWDPAALLPRTGTNEVWWKGSMETEKSPGTQIRSGESIIFGQTFNIKP
jgi:glycosidase